jgi:anti-sigma28 factor (negative regulator of flagellin synthesis)
VKIDQAQAQLRAIDAARSVLKDKRSSGFTPEGGSGDDQVTISDVARLSTQLDAISDERIRELRQKYASGTYSVDAAALSRKIVDSMKEQ